MCKPATTVAEDTALGLVIGISEADASVADGDAPVTDYARLSELTGARVVGRRVPGRTSRALRPIEKATGLDISQALRIARTHGEAGVYVSFSERVGIPLGALLSRRRRRPAHVLIAHRLGTRAKRALALTSGWNRGVDRIITLCGAQLEYAERYAPGRSAFVRQGSDKRFYCPSDGAEEDFVLSVGSENRDYPTLFEAVRRTGLKLRVLSSSPWCRRKGELAAHSAQVEILPRMSHVALRDLYRRAKIVVVPLNDVDYAAGLNGVLEAFCMGKPLIVSASRGISDYVCHMENAYVVPAGDAAPLAAALMELGESVELRERLAGGALDAVRQGLNLDSYVDALRREIAAAVDERGGA